MLRFIGLYEVLVHMINHNLVEASRYLERSGVETHQDTHSVGKYVVEGGFFHVDRLLWMALGQMACQHLAIAACMILFSTSL